MKIEKVSFDNINSLGGHFELDLQHPSLTDAGIFVISGPTGVGKTTLLDAICYALYGCTARQPKLSASSNEIMTHGASFCRAEAWVEKDGQHYLFTCEQRRKKTRVAGASPYTSPIRSVSRIGEDGIAIMLANKVREVEQWAESVMKFSNFTRCMMLAQGEFARFLKDNAAGRSEALATITGTEIYQRIGEKVQERVASLRAKIQQVALHDVLAEEERQQLTEAIAAAQTEMQAGKAALDDLNQKLTWIGECAQAEERRRVCETNLLHARQAAENFVQSGQLQRMRAAEQARQVQLPEQQVDAASRLVQQNEQQLAQEQAWLAANHGRNEQKQAEQSAAALAELEPAINARLTHLIEQVQPCEERISQAAIATQAAAKAAADRRREAAQAQDALARARHAAQNTQREQESAEAQRRQLLPDAILTESLPAIRQRLADWVACPQSEESLPAAEELAARIAAWQQERDHLLAGRRSEDLPQQLAWRQNLQRAQQRHQSAQQQLADAAQACRAAQAALDSLPPLSDARQALESAQQRYELAYKIQDAGQKLAELYREFCAGNLPCCPCCGSPVPHERPVQESRLLEETREQVQHARQHVRLCQQQQEEAIATLAAAHSAYAAAQKTTDQSARELAEALRSFGWSTPPADLAEQINKLRCNMARLVELDALRAELDAQAKRAACRAALHAALQGSSAQQPQTLAEARILVEQLSAHLRAWQAADARATQAANACDIAQERLKQARATLAEKQENSAAAQKQAAETAATEARLREELAQLWQGGPARESEAAARSQLKQLQDAAAQANLAWQKHLRAQESHRALAHAAQEQQSRLREDLAQAERQLAAALHEHGFADRAACAAARLAAPALDALRRQRDSLTQRAAAAEGAYRQAAEQESEQRARALTSESAETLTAARNAQTEQLHQQEQQLAALRGQLHADELNRRANAEKEAQIADTRTELERWQRLYEILGSSRDGFKKYAQRITFNLLLEQANAQLRRLSDRYTLLQDRDEELGLLVLDRYQDNPQGRSCSNLSGGESFIVSLALALGLSRMTGETRIDTLFLDEGFGTLDEDALENVLDCLHGLRADGKLIGIISHVEALKERMQARIELVPLGASGLSSIAAHEAVVARPGLG